MTRVLSLLVVILLVGPAAAKAADPTPKAADAVAPEAQKQPASQQAPVPKVAEPRKLKLDRDLQHQDLRTLPPSIQGTEKSRVPTSGHAPSSDTVRRVTRPPGVPSEIRGLEGVRRALTHQLRLDGRTGRVDFRGQDRAVSRLDWQLDSPESNSAFILMRRESGGGCPSDGTSWDAGKRQLLSDPSVVNFLRGVSNQGSQSIDFRGPDYRGLTDVYVRMCGLSGIPASPRFNGVASNVVHVQPGVPPVLQIPVARWSVEWSHDTSSNAACFFGGLDSGAIPPPRGAQVGFESLVTRGADPVPCIRDALYVYQPSARFDLTGLARDARILRAELLFVEADHERRSESGRLCPSATRSVGLATTPVASGNLIVEAVSGHADDTRTVVVVSGSRRSVEVADWVRAWLGGREAGVTFLGLPPRREGAACKAQLVNVRISVEYD